MHWSATASRCALDLPGVGRNLQDRYEIGVVNRMAKPWRVLDGADFTRGDRLFGEWSRHRDRHVCLERRRACGIAAVAAASAACPTCSAWRCWRSSGATSPAIRAIIAEHHDYLTWAVLKAHTNNRAGEVTLRSADPRDTPLVNFRYFDEGSDAAGDDLQGRGDRRCASCGG